MLSIEANFEDLNIAFKELNDKIYEAVDGHAKLFFDDLYERNPVDSGDMKASWNYSLPSMGEAWTWTAKNTQDYSDVITQGRRLVNGRYYGSDLGWGAGGVEVLLQKMSNDIYKEINDIKI